jgi:2-polyprenyl-6-hydroxyphenyl methylase/3-demethylubiquinone-9 3-methyltransferase
LYDRSPPWWDERSYLHFLYAAVNTARFDYFRAFLASENLHRTENLELLDIGCGGGFLTEEFARFGGFRVYGIDPSGPSLQEAELHAKQGGLDITYRLGKGEALPFPDGRFDVVCCCDVLEHVTDRSAILSEVRRVLRPGGVFLFDTINRTWLSHLAFIQVAQKCPLTRFVPADFHDSHFFVSPVTLRREMESQGLTPRCTTGLGPSTRLISLARLLHGFREVRRGLITPGELGCRFPFTAKTNTDLSYMGCAVKEE